MSAAADAAEVVDMRLGRHPEFTRVVFELDAPAGYSLEQSTLEGGGSELVVTLDASAVDQEKSLRQSLVKKVSLTGQGQRSVARIHLSPGKLRVKEMILANPPRIVLDVLAPPATKTAKTAKAVAPKRTTATTAASASAGSEPAPTTGGRSAAAQRTTRPTTNLTPIRQPRVAAVPPVASVNHGASPAPTRVVTRPAIAPAARPAATPRQPVAIAKPSPVVAQTRTPVAPSAAVKPARTPPPPARRQPASRPAPVPAAPAAIPQTTSDSLFTATHVGGGLALLGLVGGGTFFMLRRRAGREVLDDDDSEQDPFSVDNPFASLGDDPSVVPEAVPSDLSRDETAELPIAHHVDEPELNVVDEFGSENDRDIPVAKVSADAGPQEGLFEPSAAQMLGADATDVHGAESAEAAGDDMETYEDATINTGSNAMPPIPGTDAGDSSEMMRMLREFEQRMASLESRLDEVTESKERLERQVTAQTEELRVQRAAIARTQRALRNLTRPEDDSATEPALRDPNP